MQPQSRGERSSGDRRAGRLLSVALEDDIEDALRDRYRVETADSSAELGTIDPDADCLVVDGETFRALCADDAVPSAPVVVFSDTADPALMRAIARREGCDIVYRDGLAGAPREAPELERLGERIEAARGGQRAGADRDGTDDPSPDLRDTVLETARNLMGAAPDEVDTKIEWGLGSVAEALGGTRGVVYAYDDDRLRVTHEWHAAGRDPVGHEAVRAEEFPGFAAALSQFETFRTAAGEEDREEGSAAASLERFGYGSEGVFVAVPVVIDWALSRVLVVDGAPAGRLSERTETRLRTAGELIGRTLRRNDRRREIERQNERLERFASVISHDLQNPLNVITGFAELARESDDPAAIDRIEAAAERMETILEDLRTLTREAEDLGELEEVPVSAVAKRANRAVETPGATVEIGEIGRVETDPSRLRQAFENLLRNAVEHGGSDVTVRVERIEGGFAFVDDGAGFSPEDRGQVFNDGYTGGDGTGLGLAIVRTVIEAHGWAIAATEAEGGGARFEITGVGFEGGGAGNESGGERGDADETADGG